MLDDVVYHRIQQSQDGELSAEDAADLAARRATDPEVDAAWKYHAALRAKLKTAAGTPVDEAAKGRVLAGFHARLQNGGEARVYKLAPGGSSRRRWVMTAVPALAAAALVGLWLGGAFRHSHTPIIEAAVNARAAFYRDAGLSADTPVFDSAALTRVSAIPGVKVWRDNDGVCRSERFRSCEVKATRLAEPQATLERMLPDTVQLVAYRRANIILPSGIIDTPHFIFTAENREISAFVLPRHLKKEAIATLHEHPDTRQKQIDFHDCASCNVAVRCLGEMFAIFVSRMDHRDMTRWILDH